MSAKTETLRDIYLEVAGEETLTESQEDEPGREPIEERDAELEADVSSVLLEDGLDEAVDDGDSALAAE